MPVWSVDDATINITEATVDSLKGHELIIVDNGSTLGAGKLREWASVYIRNKDNFGYAYAVNMGLKLFLGETVAVANNDIRVSPNWAEVANEVINMEGVGSVHFRMIPYNEPFSYGKDDWIKGKERWCSSSFFVLRNVQLFDDNFINSCEDWDFWYRFRRKGFNTAYTNRACYQHFDSFTQQRVLDRDKNDIKNREYYKFKHGYYPDEQFAKLYPTQMEEKWRPFP